MTTTQLPDAGLDELEQYRGELTGYCYRMLGSPFDADDAVQETLVKAWQKRDGFEGRSSLRTWLYRVATNVCLDALRAGGRRAQPMDLSSPLPGASAPTEVLPQESWVLPVSDAALGAAGDPAERVVLGDSVRLAFVAALQHLPPKQRAVLLLREVLSWSAADVAELLDTTVASVNSALQRARATLATVDTGTPSAPLGEHERALLVRYVAAFEAYDIDALVSLMHDDASISMPPFSMWVAGADELKAFYRGAGSGCDGSVMQPVGLNGMPAFAQWKPSEQGGHEAWSLQVLELSDGRVAHVHHFIGPELFVHLGLPVRLPAEPAQA